VNGNQKKSKNQKPIVLIGKGVLFDTGGINIKTGDFMTDMKADMGGASAVLGTLKTIASQDLPIHVIVLTPITENRINGKELVPGDIIKMLSGKTVEVLNTDAEGRLILADSLTFAKGLNPLLVIDTATLTGSAYRITGNHGAVIMGTDEKNIKALKKAGEEVYERLVELPMWEEFEETLASNVADITNLGSSEGQAVCAGFFLKKFIDYPWIHIDIAGPAFRNKEHFYIPKGGTGFGVRLLYQFF
jgi:leucyl aminopeptidase